MSGDVMNFPDNWWKFVQQYQFADKEEIYTNGSMLIPSFRVRQMVEHYFGGKVGKTSHYAERTCDYKQAAEYWQRMYEETFAERTCELNDTLSRNGGYKCSECSAIFDGFEDDVSYDIVPNYCPNCGARVIKSDQDLAQEVGE